MQRSGAAFEKLSQTNPGTETFAAITAAFAALTVSLNVYGEQDLVVELRRRANQTFTLMESAPITSYEESLASLSVGSFWPSAGGPELFDDMLLASALMLYSDGKEARYKCAPCCWPPSAIRDRDTACACVCVGVRIVSAGCRVLVPLLAPCHAMDRGTCPPLRSPIFAHSPFFLPPHLVVGGSDSSDV